MKRRWIPVLVAVVLAMTAGAVVFLFARGTENRALAAEQPVDVYVASQPIAKGTTLQAALDGGLVSTTQVSAKLRPADSITSTSGAAAMYAVNDISAQQMLVTQSFSVTPPATTPLEVPDGKMAVSVVLDDPAKVGPFLRPGSMIAIFETITLPSKDPAAPAIRSTRLLLDRAQVLAVGPVTQTQQADAGSDAWQAQLVTVAVDQAQAEKLVQGVQTGSPYMALLGANTVAHPSDGVSDSNLFN
jgi:pilus assembly protein CpaB